MGVGIGGGYSQSLECKACMKTEAFHDVTVLKRLKFNSCVIDTGILSVS